MCGICGFITYRMIKKDELAEMNRTLIHRGPDDHGEEIYQIGAGKNIGFAHRRLAIMDLSSKGHQPMHSPDKRISVIYNGEIYNYRELRNGLKEYHFTSDCDTEVIIAAYLKWGIGFIDKVNGMFAIALLDRAYGTVYLIRDRIGKKPLFYYKNSDGDIVFASELKAIIRSSLFSKKINKQVIGRFLYRGYISSPDTIFCDTYKLESGTILEIRNDSIQKHKYWDIAARYNELKRYENTDHEQEKEILNDLLKEAVARRMIADVPVGAFLSGGYDSSLICAIAQELSPRPIKTFSVGFYDDKFDEAVYAKQIADVLGTDHEGLYIDEHDMLGILESIPTYYDEPFADPSQIPSMLISEYAKQKVSVVLSGDGGDELFGGYDIYAVLQEAQRKRWAGRILYGVGKIPGVKQTSFWKKRSIVYRILSDSNDPEARTQSGINSYLDMIDKILIDKVDDHYHRSESRYHEKDYAARRMLLDMDTYLPDDILAKVDRASMRYALECRCPILDKEVIEYSFSLPLDHKIYRGNGKRILKDIAYKYIPRSLLDRPKTGFSIPQDKWLRGVLKERIMDLTDKDRLIKQEIFEPENTIRFMDHYFRNGDSGKWSGQNFSRIVWSYFIFQQWYEKYFPV